MQKKIIVLGIGGHANVVIATLKALCLDVYALYEADNEDDIFSFPPDEVMLVNAIGSTCNTDLRKKVYQKFKQAGYCFLSIVHPKSIVEDSAKLGEGVQVMLGAILQAGVTVGDNCIINTGASIDHDCNIGHHVHIAPGTVLSGTCTIGDSTHIGTGATVIQNIKIGNACTIGAGSIVVRDVTDNQKVFGVPARVVQ